MSGCNPGVQMGVIWCQLCIIDIAWICVAGAVNFPAACLLGSTPKTTAENGQGTFRGVEAKKKKRELGSEQKLPKTALVQEVRVHQPRLAARLASTWHGSAWGWIWCATLTSPGCDCAHYCSFAWNDRGTLGRMGKISGSSRQKNI